MESLSYINVTILRNYSGIGRAYTKWEDTVQAVNTASAAHAQAVDIMPPGLYWWNFELWYQVVFSPPTRYEASKSVYLKYWNTSWAIA